MALWLYLYCITYTSHWLTHTHTHTHTRIQTPSPVSLIELPGGPTWGDHPSAVTSHSRGGLLPNFALMTPSKTPHAGGGGKGKEGRSSFIFFFVHLLRFYLFTVFVLFMILPITWLLLYYFSRLRPCLSVCLCVYVSVCIALDNLRLPSPSFPTFPSHSPHLPCVSSVKMKCRFFVH